MFDTAVQIKNKGLHPPIPSEAPEHIQQLLGDCWQLSPSQRPSFEQICDRIQSWNGNKWTKLNPELSRGTQEWITRIQMHSPTIHREIQFLPIMPTPHLIPTVSLLIFNSSQVN